MDERCCACLALLVASRPDPIAETPKLRRVPGHTGPGVLYEANFPGQQPIEYAGGAWFPHFDKNCARPGDVWHHYSDCDELPGPHVPRAWADLPTDPTTMVCRTCHVRSGGKPAPWFRLPGGEWHHVDGCGVERQLGGRESYSTPPTGATCTTCAAGLPPSNELQRVMTPEMHRQNPDPRAHVIPEREYAEQLDQSVPSGGWFLSGAGRWHRDDGCGDAVPTGAARRDLPPENLQYPVCAGCQLKASRKPPGCPYCAAGDEPAADGSHELLNVPCGPDGGLAPLVQLALDKQWQRVAAAISRGLTGSSPHDAGVTDALRAAAAVYRGES